MPNGPQKCSNGLGLTFISDNYNYPSETLCPEWIIVIMAFEYCYWCAMLTCYKFSEDEILCQRFSHLVSLIIPKRKDEIG